MITAHRTFTRRYTEKKAAIVQARNASASSSNRRRQGGASARPRNSAAGSRAVILDGHIGQTAAKQMLPPRCHIWRDLCQGGWHAHLQGFPCRCCGMCGDASWSARGWRSQIAASWVFFRHALTYTPQQHSEFS